MGITFDIATYHIEAIFAVLEREFKELSKYIKLFLKSLNFEGVKTDLNIFLMTSDFYDQFSHTNNSNLLKIH